MLGAAALHVHVRDVTASLENAIFPGQLAIPKAATHVGDRLPQDVGRFHFHCLQHPGYCEDGETKVAAMLFPRGQWVAGKDNAI